MVLALLGSSRGPRFESQQDRVISTLYPIVNYDKKQKVPDVLSISSNDGKNNVFFLYKVSDLAKNGVHLKTIECLKSLRPSSVIEAFI